VERKEQILSEVTEIAETLSMFGVIKLRWLARFLKGQEEQERAERKAAGQ
jgi:hypothetical protein